MQRYEPRQTTSTPITSGHVPTRHSTNPWPVDVDAATITVLGDGEASPPADVGRVLPASSARSAIVVRHWVTSTKASQTFGRSKSISCSCEAAVPLSWFPWSETRGGFIDIVSVLPSDGGVLSPSLLAVAAPEASAGSVSWDPSARFRAPCAYVAKLIHVSVSMSSRCSGRAPGCLGDDTATGSGCFSE